tara:strand:- start:466 stop:684 length:219 start_codon:yes stop_codon:yes gene_type:complete
MVLKRPVFRYVIFRRDNALVGNLEILRGRLWLPKPPLDVTGTTSSGKAPGYDQGVERAAKHLMAKPPQAITA